MYAVLSVGATLAITAGAVSVASGASTVKCGGLYQPTCSAPTIAAKITTRCHQAGTRVPVPKITIKSTAGLKSITVLFGGVTVKKYRNLNSATAKTLGGLSVSTTGLKPGAYKLTVKVTDTRGMKSTKTERIAICTATPPPFTG